MHGKFGWNRKIAIASGSLPAWSLETITTEGDCEKAAHNSPVSENFDYENAIQLRLQGVNYASISSIALRLRHKKARGYSKSTIAIQSQ